MDSHEKKSGLLPLPVDIKDYSYHKTFGAALSFDLPAEFKVADPLVIKNQNIPAPSDLCTAEGSTEVAEDEDSIEFSPEYHFAKAKQLLGDWSGYGCDLRTAAKVGVKFGFLPQTLNPNKLADRGRDFVANPDNYPEALDEEAAKYKRDSYFFVENFYNDLFDSIRATLWNNRSEKRSVLTGTQWFVEWETAPGGVVPKDYNFKGGQHAGKFFGWKQIGGEPYLIFQNSEGKDVGDQGLLYFPREVVNREFVFGNICFRKVSAVLVKTVDSTWLQKLIYFLKGFIWRH